MKNIMAWLKDKKVFICLACVFIVSFSMCLTTNADDYKVSANNEIESLYGPENENKNIISKTIEPIKTDKKNIVSEPTTIKMKSNEEITLEVWRGLWGNGEKRKNMLIEAGYDYLTIQPIVNKMISGEISIEKMKANSTKTEKEEKDDSLSIETEEEFIVFKESTHYVHTSNCHWYINDKESCVVIEDTSEISAILCDECNPDVEIVNEYVPEEKTNCNVESIDSYSRTLLAEIVHHEAGANWISQYNKAKVAAGVMNRVNDSRFPNTVYDVLVQRGQFSGYTPGCVTPNQDDYDAVDYYFSHTNEFNSDNSWWGDGYQNHFYYQ